jgi:hypothetical protein
MQSKAIITPYLGNVGKLRLPVYLKRILINRPKGTNRAALFVKYLMHKHFIPELRACKVTLTRGPHTGHTCGQGHFKGKQNDACYRHRCIKAKKEAKKKARETQRCTHVIIHGPRKGEQCGNFALYDNNTRCRRHRLDSMRKAVVPCDVVLYRGPRKGQLCGLTSGCVHRRNAAVKTIAEFAPAAPPAEAEFAPAAPPAEAEFAPAAPPAEAEFAPAALPAEAEPGRTLDTAPVPARVRLPCVYTISKGRRKHMSCGRPVLVDAGESRCVLCSAHRVVGTTPGAIARSIAAKRILAEKAMNEEKERLAAEEKIRNEEVAVREEYERVMAARAKAKRERAVRVAELAQANAERTKRETDFTGAVEEFKNTSVDFEFASEDASVTVAAPGMAKTLSTSEPGSGSGSRKAVAPAVRKIEEYMPTFNNYEDDPEVVAKTMKAVTQLRRNGLTDKQIEYLRPMCAFEELSQAFLLAFDSAAFKKRFPEYDAENPIGSSAKNTEPVFVPFDYTASELELENAFTKVMKCMSESNMDELAHVICRVVESLPTNFNRVFHNNPMNPEELRRAATGKGHRWRGNLRAMFDQKYRELDNKNNANKLPGDHRTNTYKLLNLQNWRLYAQGYQSKPLMWSKQLCMLEKPCAKPLPYSPLIPKSAHPSIAPEPIDLYDPNVDEDTFFANLCVS